MENLPKKEQEGSKKTSTNFDVDAQAAAVKKIISNTHRGFIEAAKTIAEAKDACSSSDYKRFYEKIGMSQSKANRYALCGRCERLKEYREQLSHIISWGTLNEIRKLSPEEFEIFNTKFLSGDKQVPIEIKDVFGCKIKKKTPRSFKFKSGALTIDITAPGYSDENLNELIMAIELINKLPGITLNIKSDFKADFEEYAYKLQLEANENEVLDDSAEGMVM